MRFDALPPIMLGGETQPGTTRTGRRTLRRQWRLPIPSLVTTVMTLLALNVVLVGWREDVVKIAPQTVSLFAALGLPVNLRGLSFSNIATVSETHDGLPVLVVTGDIVSSAPQTSDVPRLRLSIRNAQGEEIHAWTAAARRSVLTPGETLEFRARLVSPPPDGHDVVVRFINRRDMVASLQ
jgi:hypothetical protein